MYRQYEKKPQTHAKLPTSTVADIVVVAICPEDVWPMERSLWSAARSTTSGRSVEAGEMELSITRNRNQTNTMKK